MRQLLAESFTVAMAGTAVGLILANWGLKVMLALKPPDIQRTELIAINLPVFLFTAGVAILTTLLFGLAPSVAASRTDLNAALKTGSSWGSSAARKRTGQALIAAEVALALMLVTGAGLLLRSFHALTAVGIGFNTSRTAVADIDLPAKRYADGASQSRFFRELLDRVRALPGVTAANVVDNLPLHRISMSNFYIAGRPEPPIDALPMSDDVHASPGYLRMLGLRLESGRLFTQSDLTLGEQDKDTVAVVSHSFAEKFFPGESPIGKRLLSPDRKHASEIIGIVSDYRAWGVEMGARPTIFWPYLKVDHASVVVRTRANPLTFSKAIQGAVSAIDPRIVAENFQAMDFYVDRQQAQRKFNTLLLAIFAGLSLVLAAIGIYGVLSNLVASRVREIGIRMAIGASPGHIAAQFMRQSMIPVEAGLLLGLGGSLALSRFLAALLFQVHPRDPLTFALAVCGVLVVAPLALYVPLRRAMRVDPVDALHQE